MPRATRIASPAIALAVVVLALSCQPQQTGMTLEEATALSERSLPIWNEGQLDLIEEMYTPDIVRHIAGGDDVVGIDNYKAYVTALREAYPDFTVNFDEVLASGDRTISRWTVTGTHLGVYQGEPPTGKAITVTGVNINRVVDGKNAEEWVYWNDLAAWQQLGYTLERPAEPDVPAEE
jgi:steroid delta-isomerase-like uncharacterized protein